MGEKRGKKGVYSRKQTVFETLKKGHLPFGAYLRVQGRGLEAEFVNIGKERSVQLLAGCWDIQTALSLLFRHNFSVAWRSCK